MLKSVTSMLLASVVAGAAHAQDIVSWQQGIDGWDVAVDRTIGNSCFMISKVNEDVLLRFQINAAQDDVQLIIADVRWSELEAGQTYPIEITLDQEMPWTGMAEARRWRDLLPSLVMSVPMSDQDSMLFVSEFSNGGAVRIEHLGDEILNIDLAGTHQAVSELMRCQSAMSELPEQAASAV